MTTPTVYAVMKATIEIPVRPSSPCETLEQMHQAAKREAEGILRNHLGPKMHLVGQIEFSHAIVKGDA